jgi:Secretion system C-terminal sorting domain
MKSIYQIFFILSTVLCLSYEMNGQDSTTQYVRLNCPIPSTILSDACNLVPNPEIWGKSNSIPPNLYWLGMGLFQDGINDNNFCVPNWGRIGHSPNFGLPGAAMQATGPQGAYSYNLTSFGNTNTGALNMGTYYIDQGAEIVEEAVLNREFHLGLVSPNDFYFLALREQHYLNAPFIESTSIRSAGLQVNLLNEEAASIIYPHNNSNLIRDYISLYSVDNLGLAETVLYKEFTMNASPYSFNANAWGRTGSTFRLPFTDFNSSGLWITPINLNFTPTEDNFDGIFFNIDNIEIVKDNFPFDTNTASIGCTSFGADDYCMPTEVVVTYKWTDPNNYVVASYTLTHRQDGVLLINGQPSTLMPTVTPRMNGVYKLTRSIATPQDYAGLNATDLDFGSRLSFYHTVTGIPAASISASSTALCGGGSTTLTASGGSSYLWSTNQTTNTITVSPTTNTTYTVVVSDISGCSSFSIVTINAGNTSPPTAAISVNSANCAKTLSVNTGVNWSYLWSNGATNSAIVATQSGSYSVTVTNSVGCTASSAVLVNVSNPFVVSISNTSGNPIAIGTSTTITASAAGAISYEWNTGNQNASFTSSPLYANENYTVTVTNAAGCTATASTAIGVYCPLPTNSITVGSNTIYPTIESARLAGLIPANQKVGGSMVISGDLLINENYSFFGTDITIGSAGSITVPNSKTLVVSRNSILHGNGCLWKGIVVETTGTVKVVASAIQDAFRAVDAEIDANIAISQVNFDRNAIGLYADNRFNLFAFSGSSFNCTAPLAAPYTGTTVGNNEAVGNWAYAGIDLHNAEYVNLGINSIYYNSPNIFQNLNCGVIAEGTTYLDVKEARFANIAKHYNNDFDGAGIAVHNDAVLNHEGSAILEQSTTGIPATYVEYDNCDFGIYANNATAVARYNTFTDCGTSVYAQNISPDHSVAVQWGKIQNTTKGNYGVWFNQCDQAESLEIDGNDIEMSSTMSANDAIAGILINGTNTSTDLKPTITANLIKQGNAENGIVVSSMKNVILNGNGIETKNAVCRNGINVENSDAPVIKCNTVTGNSANQQNYPNTNVYEPVGIKVVATTNGQYHSNYTGDLWTGMYFNIDCSTTDLKQNIFATSHTGLNMGRNLVMNSQNDKGNIFLGDNTNSQFVFAGVNEGNPPSGTATTLQGAIVTNQTTPAAGTWVGQGHYWGVNAGAVSQPFAPTARWFVQSFAMQTHDDNCSIYETDGGINPNDVAIAQDELAIADYPEDMKKWSVRNLYEKLKENPGLVLPFSVLDNFKDSLGNSAYNELYEQAKQQQNAVKMSPTLKTTLTPKRLSIQNIIANLRLTDSLGVADSTQTDSLRLVQRKLQLTQLKVEQTDYTTVKQVYYTERNTKVNTAKYDNTLLIATELHAQNEKIVNDIYLNTVAKGNFAYTLSQKDILFDIANQCPITGGKAVYLARSLYKSIGHISYNDIALCAVQGVSFRTQKPKEVLKSAPDLGIKIYPNPAQSYTTLLRKIQAEEDASIQVIDVLGRPIYSTVWYKNQSEINLNTTDFAAGVYTIKVSNGFTAKLSIIK